MGGRSVDILINAKDNASSASNSATASFKKLGAELGVLKGALIGGIGGVGIAAGFKAILGSFTEAENATAKLKSVLRATGNASGFSLQQMRAYAGELQDLVAVDDDVIASNMGILASFKNIRGDVFKEATKAALDLSNVMGQDLQSSIVQIGKALNDPTKGLTALGRIGVTFSESQKEVINSAMKSNDILKAQQVILAELNSEFGGAAADAANTLSGSISKLSLAFDGLKTSIGGAMAPTLTAWLKKATDIVNEQTAATNPATQQGLDSTKNPSLMHSGTREEKNARLQQLDRQLLAAQKEKRDLIVKASSFWTASFNDVAKIVDADTAIKNIAMDIKTLQQSFDPRVNAANGINKLFDGIIQGAPKAVEALQAVNAKLKEQEAEIKARREADRAALAGRLGDMMGGKQLGQFGAGASDILRGWQAGLINNSQIAGFGINAILGGFNPKNIKGVNDVFGSNPFMTQGGRLQNDAVEGRGLHRSPFTEQKPELKTQQDILRELQATKRIQEQQLQMMKENPALTKQILEIRKSLD